MSLKIDPIKLPDAVMRNVFDFLTAHPVSIISGKYPLRGNCPLFDSDDARMLLASTAVSRAWNENKPLRENTCMYHQMRGHSVVKHELLRHPPLQYPHLLRMAKILPWDELPELNFEGSRELLFADIRLSDMNHTIMKFNDIMGHRGVAVKIHFSPELKGRYVRNQSIPLPIREQWFRQGCEAFILIHYKKNPGQEKSPEDTSPHTDSFRTGAGHIHMARELLSCRNGVATDPIENLPALEKILKGKDPDFFVLQETNWHSLL